MSYKSMQLVCLAIAVLLLTGLCIGQTATGLPPYASLAGGPDAVNLSNLNIHLQIPIISKAGSGMPFTYSLSYDTSIWYPGYSSGLKSWLPVTTGSTVASWGWTPQGSIAGYVSEATTQTPCYNSQGQQIGASVTMSNWTYIDSSGAAHAVAAGNIFIPNACPGTAVTSFTNASTSDGSGFVMSFNTNWNYALVTSRSGITYNLPLNPGNQSVSGTITDTNGNTIVPNGSGGFTDTLGINVLNISGAAPSNTNFTYWGPADSSSPATSTVVSYKVYNVRTNFACSGISEYGPASVNLVDKITLPDGTYYQFNYEGTYGYSGYYTGRVASVTLPTGGTISYNYADGAHGINCADGSLVLLARSTPDGSWTYLRQGADPSWITTVTDPQSNQTAIQFQKSANLGNYYETQRSVYQGATSGTLLQTTVTCYDGSTAMNSCPTAAITNVTTQRRIYTEIPNSTGKVSETNTILTPFGLPQETDEYDFGVGGPASNATRKTLIHYATTASNGASLGNILDHPSSVAIGDGASPSNIKAETNYSYDTHGNALTVAILSSTGYLTTTYTYNANGTVASIQDPNTSTTTVSYSGTGGCANAWPTSVSLPTVNIALSTSTTWNCYGAVPKTQTDFNGNVTSYTYNDSNKTWRPTAISHPDGGSTTYGYVDSPNWFAVGRTDTMNGSQNSIHAIYYDGLGRVRQQVGNSDPDGTTYVDTTYDSLGRVASVSNPYRSTSDSTYGLTTYGYDALSRTTKVTHPDGSAANYTYSGAAVLAQDEGVNSSANIRVSRILQSDGLGRTTKICEVSSSNLQGFAPSACGLDYSPTTNGFLTGYGYDLLNNVTSVSQVGVNTRAYSYDGLSRLTSETNPESGATTYNYDSVGDLYQRIRPLQNQTNASTTVTTTYAYDTLHRLTQRSYSDNSTPTAYFSYDSASQWGVNLTNYKGRLVLENTVAPGMGSKISTGSIYLYDSMGRVTGTYVCVPSTCNGGKNGLSYTYDYLGNLTSATDGVSTTVYYAYNPISQLTQVTSSLTGTNYPSPLISGMHYNAFGLLTSGTLGGSNLALARSYDKLGRVTSLTDGTAYTQTGFNYAPNSSVLGYTDSVNGTWTYSYDEFNRLASSAGPSSAFTYNYDPAGNRWHQTLTSGTGPSPSSSFNPNNQIVGGSYDAAGNLLTDGAHTYTYDAEGRVFTVTDANYQYVYDTEGKRVARGAIASWTSFTPSTQWFFGIAQHQVTEISGSGGYLHTNVYANGQLLATYGGSTTWFALNDFLGTKRSEMYPNSAVQQSYTGLPYGDSLTSVGSGPDATEAHFTGQDHDAETNTDHFLARQYSPMQGRWMSPDPAGLEAVHATNPQTWNRYAYVLNSPINGTDPLGLYKPVPRGGGGDPLGGGGLACYMCGGFGGPDPGNYGGSVSGGPTGSSMSGLLGGNEPTVFTGRNGATYVQFNGGATVNINTGEDLSSQDLAELGFDSSAGSDQNSTSTLSPSSAMSGTSSCIARGIQAISYGISASPGGPTQEVGGHWNFAFTLQFSSPAAASTFTETYLIASNGWSPPARFGSGPALHLENLGWSFGGDSISATGHIDLFNPNTGPGGIAGHVFVDGLVGHVVQLLGGNIDPKGCPFK